MVVLEDERVVLGQLLGGGGGGGAFLLLEVEAHHRSPRRRARKIACSGPGANRFWLRSAVRRICRFAGTPLVGPHGLRGTHATLAVEAGVTGDAVAASLGHGSFSVTAGHYAKAEAITSARIHQIEIW